MFSWQMVVAQKRLQSDSKVTLSLALESLLSHFFASLNLGCFGVVGALPGHNLRSSSDKSGSFGKGVFQKSPSSRDSREVRYSRDSRKPQYYGKDHSPEKESLEILEVPQMKIFEKTPFPQNRLEDAHEPLQLPSLQLLEQLQKNGIWDFLPVGIQK